MRINDLRGRMELRLIHEWYRPIERTEADYDQAVEDALDERDRDADDA